MYFVVFFKRGGSAAGAGLAGCVVATVLLFSGCEVVSNSAHAQQNAPSASGSPSTSAPKPTPAAIKITPADRTTGVLPSSPVTVSASTGTLETATVKDDKGRTVDGKRAADGSWSVQGLLRPSAVYTVTAVAKGSDGTPTTVTSKFTTLKPKVTATYTVLYSGATVGVGMPVSIQFDSPVATTAERAQIEKLVSVKTTPKTTGHWGWLDNRQLMWRPKAFWAPGTKVTVNAPLAGVQTGPDKWVVADAQGGFTIGSAMITSVDMKTHQATVTRDGHVLRTIPVSTGKPGEKTETRYGTKVIIDRESAITMDSSTVGIPKGNPEYYKIDTKWNLRLTWTGEFIHSAPWSVSAQGSTNVSHGCTNMAPANAEWMYTNSKAGDVVKFTGSNRPFQPTEGIGVWQYSYNQWMQRSALS